MPTGVYKRKPLSEETKRKISVANKGKSHPVSAETKEKMRQIMKGRRPKNLDSLHKINRGANHAYWKGDKAGMGAIHDYVRRHKGRPTTCEDCGTTSNDTKIEWSNVDHKYRRELSDWNARCCKCHKAYDKANNNYSNGGVFKKGYIMSAQVREKISKRMKEIRAKQARNSVI